MPNRVSRSESEIGLFANSMKLVSINPTTEEVLQRYAETSEEGIAETLVDLNVKGLAWRNQPLTERAAVLRAIGAELLKHRDDLALMATLEMGKPIVQARAEVEKCAAVCAYYATQGPSMLREEVVQLDADRKGRVSYQAMGTVLAIMPWNFPYWQVFRFAAPALLAGNAILLKHAPNVTGCALLLEKLLRSILPTLLPLRVLCIASSNVDSVTERLLSAPDVRAVTFTGSSTAAARVAELAGRYLKKSLVEGGGSDPFLVFGDADLEKAADLAARSRLNNAGQSCIAAKRFFVEKGAFKEFADLLQAEMERRQIGDPQLESTDLGPLARKDLREQLNRQVDQSIAAGAVLRWQSPATPEKGFFGKPAILEVATLVGPVGREEVFGPVATLVPFGTEEEAVQLANATDFGLGATIVTTDRARAERLAERGIEAGACFINSVVQSDPRLPFGGVKRSGFGRELSQVGLREFVNIKTIVSSAL